MSRDSLPAERRIYRRLRGELCWWAKFWRAAWVDHANSWRYPK